MLIAVNAIIGMLDTVLKKLRPDHAMLIFIVHLLGISLWLSFWPPVLLKGLGGPLDAATFFAWWAYLWLCMVRGRGEGGGASRPH